MSGRGDCRRDRDGDNEGVAVVHFTRWEALNIALAQAGKAPMWSGKTTWLRYYLALGNLK